MRKGMEILHKSIAVLMAVIVFLGCMQTITGCSNQKNEQQSILDPQNPVKVILWHYYNGIQQNSFNTLVEEFNITVGAEKGIVVEAHSYGSVEELSNSLNDSINGKIGSAQCPHIFSAYKDTAYTFDQAGQMVDLREYFSEEELGEYVEDYLESSYILDQTVKLLPVVKSTEQLFLNKTDWDKFAAETGVLEDSLSTWEGIAEVAEIYYNWSGGKAFFGRDAMANYILVGAAQLGRELVQVDSSGAAVYNFDKETIKKLWDNYYVPYVKGYYIASGKFRSDDAKTGKLIACIASSSSANYIPKSVTLEDGESYDIDVKVFPTPGFSGYNSYAVQQGAGMGVMKSDQQHEYAACEFLKWFTDSQQNCTFSMNSGYLPVEKNAKLEQMIDVTKELTTTEKALQVGMEMMDTYNYFETPVFANADSFRYLIGDLMSNQCSEDRKKVEAAVASGISQEEAVAEYITDVYFDAWYENFVEQISALK